MYHILTASINKFFCIVYLDVFQISSLFVLFPTDYSIFQEWLLILQRLSTLNAKKNLLNNDCWVFSPFLNLTEFLTYRMSSRKSSC